jgi:hypothetical protein
MRPCSICQREDLNELNAALEGGVSIRAIASTFGVDRRTLSRHSEHSPRAASAPSSALGAHGRAAEGVIGELRTHFGDDWGAQEDAEAELLRAVARLADVAPKSPAALKELRSTLADFRRLAEPDDGDLDDAALELIHRLSGATAGRQTISRPRATKPLPRSDGRSKQKGSMP